MRFLPFESEDLQKEIEASNLLRADFKFIKRQGKMNVFYQKNSLPFKFFRKESTHLSSNGKWEKRSTYFVYEGSNQKEVVAWSSLIESFQNWLKQL